jgi:hypothetical protein
LFLIIRLPIFTLVDAKTKQRIARLEMQAARMRAPGGQPLKVLPDGGLGFLALGAVGTAAVRKAKRENKEGGDEQK